MKKTMGVAGLGFAMVLMMAAGCSKSPNADAGAPKGGSDSAAVQGTWKGQELGGDTNGSPTLVLAGAKLEFHGGDTNEWYKATFTLHEDKKPKQLIAVITECPFPQYVGKTANAIYRIENGALTIAANEPGNPEMPKAFDAPGLRSLVFKMEK